MFKYQKTLLNGNRFILIQYLETYVQNLRKKTFLFSSPTQNRTGYIINQLQNGDN